MEHKNETTGKESLIKILDLLDSLNIRYWVDGGWGIDILLGKQTRAHRDIDIDFDGAYEDVLLAKLKDAGYTVTTDWSPSRIELHHSEYGYIDIHPLQISESGSASQAMPDGAGWYDFKAEWFSSAAFEGRSVPCISAEAQRLFHSGYAPREIDRLDMAQLDALIKSNTSRDDYIDSVTIGERTPLNGTVLLADYDPGWPSRFESEASGIQAALGDKALAIHHVGSTAVPGLCAKPVIDILLLVRDSALEADYLPQMEAAGYMLRIREPDWYAHRLFKGPHTDINLHVFSEDCQEAARMLAFRNWLCGHENDRDLYATAKRELAGRTWTHIQHYADAKSEVVADIMSRVEKQGKVMPNILIAYYSLSKSTENFALEIARLTEGTLLEIVPQRAYSFDYNTAAKEVRAEIGRGYCPPLLHGHEPIDAYKVVFAGTPNWFKSIAPPVLSFLRAHDFTGKTLVPFCTHGGGGFGGIEAQIAQECPSANLLPGMAASGAVDAKEIAAFLSGIGLLP